MLDTSCSKDVSLWSATSRGVSGGTPPAIRSNTSVAPAKAATSGTQGMMISPPSMPITAADETVLLPMVPALKWTEEDASAVEDEDVTVVDVDVVLPGGSDSQQLPLVQVNISHRFDEVCQCRYIR